jgi:hypothetical protein
MIPPTLPAHSETRVSSGIAAMPRLHSTKPDRVRRQIRIIVDVNMVLCHAYPVEQGEGGRQKRKAVGSIRTFYISGMTDPIPGSVS